MASLATSSFGLFSRMPTGICVLKNVTPQSVFAKSASRARRATGLDFLRLELFQDIPLEVARATEKTLLSPIKWQPLRQAKLD